MKNLISTTTGAVSAQMILDHCGDYAGKFQDEAFAIFQELWDSVHTVKYTIEEFYSNFLN